MIGQPRSGLGLPVVRLKFQNLPEEQYRVFAIPWYLPEEKISLTDLRHRQRSPPQSNHLRDHPRLPVQSAAALREAFPTLPLIGTEPAIKPAVERHPGGRILMMATAMTVKEEKFQRLRRQYEQAAEIIPIPCSGLMEFVEQGILRGEPVSSYLFEKLSPYLKVPVDAVVLGCTHYAFLRGEIRKIVGRTPEILDGSYGIAMQLRRRLEAVDGLNDAGVPGQVHFENSLDEPEILELSRALLHYEDEEL